MANTSDVRQRNTKNNIETELSSLTEEFLKGYISLPNGNGTMKVDENILIEKIKNYIKESVKSKNFVEIDKNDQQVEPEIEYDGNTLTINNYSLDILPISELTNQEYIRSIYDAIESEYDYVAQIESQIIYAEKIFKGKHFSTVGKELLSDKMNVARSIVAQEDAVKDISTNEAYIILGPQLARSITPKMMTNLGLKRKDSTAYVYGNRDAVTKEELLSDLRAQCMVVSNHSMEDMISDFSDKKLNPLSVDDVVKQNPTLLDKYKMLRFEYDELGNPKTYKKVKETIEEIKTESEDNYPEYEENIQELTVSISSRIVQRKVNDVIARNGSETELYNDLLEEFGQEDFQKVLPAVHEYLENNSLTQINSTSPMINSSLIEDAIYRVSPKQKKNGEIEPVVPDELYSEYIENARKLEELQLPRNDPSREQDSEKLDKILENIIQINNELKMQKEEEGKNETASNNDIRIDPNVIINDDDSDRHKNVDNHKVININIDRSKYVDNSDHSINNTKSVEGKENDEIADVDNRRSHEKDKDVDRDNRSGISGKDEKTTVITEPTDTYHDTNDISETNSDPVEKNQKSDTNTKEKNVNSPDRDSSTNSTHNFEPETYKAEPTDEEKKQETNHTREKQVNSPDRDPSTASTHNFEPETYKAEPTDEEKKQETNHTREKQVNSPDRDPSTASTHNFEPETYEVEPSDKEIVTDDKEKRNTGIVGEDSKDKVSSNGNINIKDNSNNTHVNINVNNVNNVQNIQNNVFINNQNKERKESGYYYEANSSEGQTINPIEIEGKEVKELPYKGEKEKVNGTIDPSRIALNESFIDCAVAISIRNDEDLLSTNEFKNLVESYIKRIEDGTLSRENLKSLIDKTYQLDKELKEKKEKIKELDPEKSEKNLRPLEAEMEKSGYLDKEKKKTIKLSRRLYNKMYGNISRDIGEGPEYERT